MVHGDVMFGKARSVQVRQGDVASGEVRLCCVVRRFVRYCMAR